MLKITSAGHITFKGIYVMYLWGPVEYDFRFEQHNSGIYNTKFSYLKLFSIDINFSLTVSFIDISVINASGILI
jgi:hypothetical protein